ncbi:MAG: hypothetical protein GWP09_02520 [Nitrospiraceae bacterium]|nr:hypothetical protein [Nitrospiraceae bacterium]
MIVEESFLKRMREFGLNSYEAKIWTALLSRGVSSAGELAEISNVPRSRSYDVLETLEKKGFIVSKIGKPMKYLAIPPEEVIDRVKKKVIKETEEKKRMLDELKQTSYLKELNDLYHTGVEKIEPNEYNGIIIGRDRIYSEIYGLIKKAKQSVEIMTSKTEAKEFLTHLYPALTTLNKNGVPVKVALPFKDANLDNEIIDLIEGRDTPQIENRMVIVDKKDSILMLFHDQEVHHDYDTAIWIRSNFFNENLSKMFNAIWENSNQIKK